MDCSLLGSVLTDVLKRKKMRLFRGGLLRRFSSYLRVVGTMEMAFGGVSGATCGHA